MYIKVLKEMFELLNAQFLRICCQQRQWIIVFSLPSEHLLSALGEFLWIMLSKYRPNRPIESLVSHLYKFSE